MPVNDKKLLQLRMSKGLSQSEVARCANITQATLSYMESGKYSDYRVGQLEALARFYEVSVDYLLDYVPDEVFRERHFIDDVKEHIQESLIGINRLLYKNETKQSNKL